MQKNKNTLYLFLVVFADMMGFSVIFPLFPETIKHYLQFPDDVLFSAIYSFSQSMGGDNNPSYTIVLFGGILGSIYAILQFVFSPIWGKMSDSFGRKKILVFTSLGNFLGYVLWFFSASFSAFVLSRIITGAMGGNISVASAGMADSTSREDRAKGMGMIGAGIGLGFIFGPTLGGLLSGVEVGDWLPALSNTGLTIFSSSALVSVVVSLLNLLLVMFFLTETHKVKQFKEDSKSDKENTKDDGDDSGIISLLGGGSDKESIHPILDFLRPGFKGLIFISLIYFAFIYSFSGFEFSLNFFLNETLLFSPKEIGLTFLYIGAIIILIQGGLIRRLSGKVPEKSIALAGIICLTMGYMGLVWVYHSYFPFLLFFSLGVLAVGSALMHPALSSMASLGSDATNQGKNLGIFRSFGSLGRAVSPISFALLYFGYTAVSVFITALGISVLLGILLFRVTTPARMDSHT